MTQIDLAGRQAQIYGCFDAMSDIHPDKSTEFLLQMTADTMSCDIDDVVAALEAYAISSTHGEAPAK